MLSVCEFIVSGKNLYEQAVLPVCRAHGLTYMEFTVLMFLKNNPQYDTAAQIARVRQLAKSHVSLSLKGLQARGLVERVYAPHNRKTLHLRLTERAAPILEAGDAAQKEFGDRLMRGFTPEEVTRLQSLMEKLYGNMKQEEGKHGK